MNTTELLNQLDKMIEENNKKKEVADSVTQSASESVAEMATESAAQSAAEQAQDEESTDQLVDMVIDNDDQIDTKLASRLFGIDQIGEHKISDEEEFPCDEKDFIEDVGDNEQISIQHPAELVRGWKDWFSEHPNKAKQTYQEHLVDSLSLAFISLSCFLVFLIHGIFPFMFEFTGSDWVLNQAQHLDQTSQTKE